MAAVIPGLSLSKIEEVINNLGLEPLDPAVLQELLDKVQAIENQVNGEFFNDSPVGVENELVRVIVENFVQGRDTIVEPFFIVDEGEEFRLNGSIFSPIVLNQGTIFDDGLLGDNIFSGFLSNEGVIDFVSGQVDILAITGGLANGGLLSTGFGTDLVSGTATGSIRVDGILNEGLLTTGVGGDQIIGNALGLRDVDGIENSGGGEIITGRGDDLIDGEAAGTDGVGGINNDNSGVIRTGLGEDQIIGFADDLTGLAESGEMSGILNRGNSLIDAGVGEDLIEGVAVVNAVTDSGRIAGINNDSSLIKLGSGEDGLFGEALAAGATSASGVFSLQGEIDAGAGEDFVFGLGESQGGQQVSGVALVSSRLRLGSGEDVIQGLASGGLINAGVFVDQNSVINAGTGEDSLLGWGFSTEDNSAIRNFGLIKMGRGSDLVDASFGGFSGDGLTNLGAGDDQLLGFGTGFFNGGRGLDTLQLGEGEYLFDSAAGTLVSAGITMNLANIEQVGGFADTQFLLLQDGTYIVNAENQIQFV